ncbi:Sls1p [Sugiyamaella lignohabitans]|uniref:Sls1p n=1 Tax=Sugiyamaella lignohabitans TaxID=796027 RepID=A0A167EA13_9ASCO|nr:Sls1p [Sugiyamaella lignohabitans]ANB13823.1 Sls1p [Sugiyamaella lignohabitans]
MLSFGGRAGRAICLLPKRGSVGVLSKAGNIINSCTTYGYGIRWNSGPGSDNLGDTKNELLSSKEGMKGIAVDDISSLKKSPLLNQKDSTPAAAADTAGSSSTTIDSAAGSNTSTVDSQSETKFSGSETTENVTGNSHSLAASKTRGKKLPPPPQEYIILGARSSRVIPKHRRPKTNFSRDIKVDDLDEQRKQLLVFTSSVPIGTAIANIDRMKPSASLLSPKRYDQLVIDLKRSFAVPQLREYIREKSNSTLRSSGTKAQLINTILLSLWRVSASQSVSESSDVIIERTFQLTRRELFIIVSQNSKLPRSWTKSGASIVILGDEQKIIVRATADTCNWIMASLHKTLQSIQDNDIDFSCLEPFASINDIPLDQIQRLSDTYLRYQQSEKMLVASSKSKDHAEHARRLILHSSGFTPKSISNYIYEDSNFTPRSLSRIIDDDALAWNERSRIWKRWKKVRSKQPFSSFERLRNLGSQPKNIVLAQGKINKVAPQPSTLKDSYEDSVSNILLKNLEQEDSNNQLTFTATFGYLLHEAPSESNAKSAADPSYLAGDVQRTFLSNVPFVFQRCSELSLYHNEIYHDPSKPPPPPKPSPDSGSTTATSSAWNKLLSNAKLLTDSVPSTEDDSLVPVEGTRGLLDDDNMRLVQIKFIPSPFHLKDSDKLQKLPPVEMWFELKENSDECDLDSLRLVSADHEANSYLSLPDYETDIKFSATSANFLDHNEQEGVNQFLSRAQLGISGNKKIYVPNELKLKMPGFEDDVTYLYQSMCYRRQIDLGFKGHILQLSSLESGGFGGRRIEANLVLDFPDGSESVSKSEVKSFVNDALEFCESLRRRSIHL